MQNANENGLFLVVSFTRFYNLLAALSIFQNNFNFQLSTEEGLD